MSQIKFFETKKVYSTHIEEFSLSPTCSGIDVTTELATQNEFRVVAKAGIEVWSVNQQKMIIKIKLFQFQYLLQAATRRL